MSEKTPDSRKLGENEALIDEAEDLDLARSRLQDPEAEWVSHEQVVRELEIDDMSRVARLDASKA